MRVTMRTEREVGCWADLDRRRRGVVMLHWALATMAVAVGIFAHDSWSELHPVFGLLLLALVFSEFYWHAKCSHIAQRSKLREFSRHVARIVLLLVYIVVFVKQGLAAIGAVDRVGEFGSHLGGYAACAAAALLAIRVTARFLQRTGTSDSGSLEG
jgi:hypothetical protein